MASGSSPQTDAPPRSLDRQVVLEEDEYTEALSHIIARDFFPSLVHLDATNNYLDALKSQDPTRIQATVRRMEEINTPITSRRNGATPTPYGGRGTYDTPLMTPYGSDQYRGGDGEGGEPLPKRRKYDTDMSLDNFQARYTSEDNASFLEILSDENNKRKEMYGWAYDAQKRVEEQRERLLEGRERLLIELPQVSLTGVKEKLRIEAPKPVGLITQGETKKEKGKEVAVVSGTKEEEVVDVMAPQKDTRAAGVDGWKFKVSSPTNIPRLACTDSISRREMLLCLLRMQTYHPTRGRMLLEYPLTPRSLNMGIRGYLSKKSQRLPVVQSLLALLEAGSMPQSLEYHVCCPSSSLCCFHSRCLHFRQTEFTQGQRVWIGPSDAFADSGGAGPCSRQGAHDLGYTRRYTPNYLFRRSCRCSRTEHAVPHRWPFKPRTDLPQALGKRLEEPSGEGDPIGWR